MTILPVSKNLSLWWNFGSLSGICLILQISTGLFLSFYYSAHISTAFERVSFICREINNGWIIRTAHANGASLFFICLYLHIGRGIYYQSYYLKTTWFIGVTLFLLTIGTAFLGYVLPWGQISFWGATVITNLARRIPFIGTKITIWLWGRFSVNNPTLTRFFRLHFLLPFIILIIVIIHLISLHSTGSNNPLGLKKSISKIPFISYYIYKDIYGALTLLILLFILVIYYPYFLRDPDNFIPANAIVTPVHIQPEWYFLFAYAILRSIPNKLGGIIALLISILILFTLPFIKTSFQGSQFYSFSKPLFWVFINTVLILTWIGICPVEIPYILLGKISTIIYFSFYLILPLIKIYTNKNL